MVEAANAAFRSRIRSNRDFRVLLFAFVDPTFCLSAPVLVVLWRVVCGGGGGGVLKWDVLSIPRFPIPIWPRLDEDNALCNDDGCRCPLVGVFIICFCSASGAGDDDAKSAEPISRRRRNSSILFKLRFVIAERRTNMPHFLSQTKYRLPFTLPSFRPRPRELVPVSRTPTQSPPAKAVGPRSATTPSRVQFVLAAEAGESAEQAANDRSRKTGSPTESSVGIEAQLSMPLR